MRISLGFLIAPAVSLHTARQPFQYYIFFGKATRNSEWCSFHGVSGCLFLSGYLCYLLCCRANKPSFADLMSSLLYAPEFMGTN